jgi:hypothetical protein
MIDIDDLVEIWQGRARADDDLAWWREACQCLRPTPEDDARLEDEEEKR